MPRRRPSPHPAKEIRDDEIRFVIRQVTEGGARLAALEHHRMKGRIGLENPNGRFTVPESEAIDLVFGLHVRHAQLQDDVGAVLVYRWRNPRAACLPAPWLADGQFPSGLELRNEVRKARKPGHSFGNSAAGGGKPLRNEAHLLKTFARTADLDRR
jgi:hypothetical protein